MSKKDIQNVIKIVPELTNFGIGIYENGRGKSIEEQNRIFIEEQEILLNSIESFDKTVDWLSKINKIKTINRGRSSYGLKHIAEKQIGYIANGVFIAAAIHCGFNYKIYSNFPNISFNMSEKSIKQQEAINDEYNDTYK